MNLSCRPARDAAHQANMPVAHRQYTGFSVTDLGKEVIKGEAFIDVKAVFDQRALEAGGYRVWRL